MMPPIVLSVQRLGEYQAIARLAVPAEHPAFAGHFPGRPVLPGVVQLDWAVRLAASCFGFRFRPALRVRVKFMRIIAPDPDRVSVTLRHDPARNEISFEYRLGEDQAAGPEIGVTATSGLAWLGP